MDSCFNSLIRLSKYRESQPIIGDGMSFSGSLWIMENDRSSSLLCSLWKNFFSLLRSLISMSISISSLQIFLYIMEKSHAFTNSIGRNGEKGNGTC